MSFQSLPAEMLLCIADEIEDHRDLAALSQTCRSAHWVLDWQVYKKAARSTDKSYLESLIIANKDPEALQNLFDAGLDPEVGQYDPDVNHGRFKRGPLLSAVWFGRLSMLEVLLKNMSAEQLNKLTNGRTIVHDACQSIVCSTDASLCVLSRLLECDKVDPDLENGVECAPFEETVACGRLDMTEILLATGKVDILKNHPHPFRIAWRNKDERMVDMFLDTGITTFYKEAQFLLEQTPMDWERELFREEFSSDWLDALKERLAQWSLIAAMDSPRGSGTASEEDVADNSSNIDHSSGTESDVENL